MDNVKEAPRYRVNTLSWIGDDLVREGREVPYKGIPGSNLEPVNAAAEAMVAKYGRREVPEMPLLVEPSPPPMPVDWQALAVANGWQPAPPAEPEKMAQAPQPAPKPAAPAPKPIEGKAGGAASKLNPPAGSADI